MIMNLLLKTVLAFSIQIWLRVRSDSVKAVSIYFMIDEARCTYWRCKDFNSSAITTSATAAAGIVN